MDIINNMEYDIKYLFLRNHDLLRHLNDIEIKDLHTLAEFKNVKKDGIIYSPTEEIDRIYFLNQGRIKIANCVENKLEVVSEILKEGDIFGELTLKKSANIHFEFAQVLSEKAVICSFGMEAFENVLRQNSGLAIDFSKMVAEKLKVINGKYCGLVFKDVRARVLSFFMVHAKYEAKWTGNTAEINMYCTHQDIANFTASRRQTVSTVINTLVKEKKIIYKGRTKVIIPDIRNLV